MKQNIEGINVYFDKVNIAIQKKLHAYSNNNKDRSDFLVINRGT